MNIDVSQCRNNFFSFSSHLFAYLQLLDRLHLLSFLILLLLLAVSPTVIFFFISHHVCYVVRHVSRCAPHTAKLITLQLLGVGLCVRARARLKVNKFVNVGLLLFCNQTVASWWSLPKRPRGSSICTTPRATPTAPLPPLISLSPLFLSLSLCGSSF